MTTSATRLEALGYADLFNGGIYGALGERHAHAKRRVIQRILTENGLDGSQLAVFGDGPVELRESRRRQGAAIGDRQRRGPPLRPRSREADAARRGRRTSARARLLAAGAPAGTA